MIAWLTRFNRYRKLISRLFLISTVPGVALTLMSPWGLIALVGFLVAVAFLIFVTLPPLALADSVGGGEPAAAAMFATGWTLLVLMGLSAFKVFSETPPLAGFIAVAGIAALVVVWALPKERPDAHRARGA